MVKQLLSLILFAAALAAAGALAPSACARNRGSELRVGVTSGPHAQIMEVVAAEALRLGVRVRVVEFSDYVQPNAALADGSLDVNSFQHRPYLEQQQRDRGYRFEVLGQTVTFPMAAYSRRHASLDALPAGATLAIPNDPTNGARALALFAQAGLIRLREVPAPGVHDVVGSRGGYRLREVDAAQLVRALDDVDLAVINTNYALEAGLDPFRGLLRESPRSPYANVLVVRAGESGRPEVRRLLAAYRSPAVRAFIDRTFRGAVVAAW